MYYTDSIEWLEGRFIYLFRSFVRVIVLFTNFTMFRLQRLSLIKLQFKFQNDPKRVKRCTGFKHMHTISIKTKTCCEMITADCLRVSCSFARIIRILPYLIVVCTLGKLFPVPFSAQHLQDGISVCNPKRIWL